MIAKSTLKTVHCFKKISKLKFPTKNLASLINISFAHAHAAICIHEWLKCYMSLV